MNAAFCSELFLNHCKQDEKERREDLDPGLGGKLLQSGNQVCEIQGVSKKQTFSLLLLLYLFQFFLRGILADLLFGNLNFCHYSLQKKYSAKKGSLSVSCVELKLGSYIKAL